MRSNTKLKLAGMMLGAALTSTTAVAASGGSCGAGKCGGDMKKVEKKGSCGSGKCGADMQKEMKGSTGSAKCGGDMKSNDMKNDMHNNSMKKDKKVTGSCGAGKCGS
ncbi:HvfA family oxazolone/thioamide-modified RiPP metallophore [Malaciobacter canalis]|jgi:uncharacterized low-complexity protein|uniref:HvfA family oxazolone/thioamide-modified RiPP metallophore n=1 Tax=Malaciobacter canalis TaxID=1912871 RepID=UPI00174CEF10|nr:hypothetical protein [Malaciobacter canalis]QEE31636.1 hypothetical protein ACAN_0099 [Malaciobacter canalis]